MDLKKSVTYTTVGAMGNVANSLLVGPFQKSQLKNSLQDKIEHLKLVNMYCKLGEMG